MKRIAELVVKIAELAEAEGRTLLSVTRLEADKLNAAVGRLAVGFAVLLIAAPLVSAGVGLLAYGGLLALDVPLGRPAAAAIIGALVAGSGVLCIAKFKRIIQP